MLPDAGAELVVGIPLDIQPIPVYVPKRPVSTPVAGRVKPDMS